MSASTSLIAGAAGPAPTDAVTVLAVSGSLRAGSSNTALLRAAARLAPPGVRVDLYSGLGGLPAFNPDLDGEGQEPPPAVAEWRALLRSADAVLVSTPEYAHGVPGALKNALDWVVGTGEFMGKPAGLVDCSPGSTHARASLAETLSVMMAVLPDGASVTVSPNVKRMDDAGMAGSPEVAGPLRAALTALVQACHAGRTGG